MKIAIVVAYDENRGIGAHDDLPWGRSLPADLAHFKRLTDGGSVIMGRKTFESIGSRPLPNRQNIVLSRSPIAIDGVLYAKSLEEAINMAQDDIFIIGGQGVFEEALPQVSTIYATEVHHTFSDVDTYFPVPSDTWLEVSRVHHPADEKNKYSFDFVEYRRG